MPGLNDGNEIEIDMESAAGDLASELGFGEPGSVDDDLDELPAGENAPTDSSKTTSVEGKGTQGEENPKPEEVPGEGQPKPGDAPKPGEAPKPADPTGVPSTWSKEAAAVWDTIPERARQEILKREADMFRGLEAYKNDAAVGRRWSMATAQHEEILKQYNIDPVALTRELMTAHRVLSLGSPEAKIATMRRLMTDYQIPIEALAEAPYEDPEVARLRRENEQLQFRQSQAQMEQSQARAQQVRQEIETFAADPANRYFDEVAQDIAVLIKGDGRLSLKEAYDKAVWANPVTRAKEVSRLESERQAKEAADKQAAEAKRKAEAQAARRANAANVRPRPKDGGSGTASPNNLDQALNEAYDKLMGQG